MNQNKKSSKDKNISGQNSGMSSGNGVTSRQGISSSGSNGQMGKQAGGSPSYEDERKTKEQGIGARSGQQNTDSPRSGDSRRSGDGQDTEMARKVGDQQTTLNSSGLQEGSRGSSENADLDRELDEDQQSQRRSA